MRKLLFVLILIVGSGIVFGQSLEKGAVMMLNIDSEVELKPGVSMNEYIDFLFTTVKPKLEEVFPGTKYVYMKGENPEKVNCLITMWYFESAEVRDKYLTPDFIYKDNKNMGLIMKLDEMGSEYVVKNAKKDKPPWPMNTSWLVL